MTTETKKIFTEPDCEVLCFSFEDILTTSGEEDNWKLPEL